MNENRRRMEPGHIVGDRFVIGARAGAGGMGTVYHAHDRASGAKVAVKVVTESAPEAFRFMQEARLLGELEHPAIVRYVAHGADEAGRSYLVMEWLDGEDLSSRLAREPLSIDETIELARKLADALAHAHARGIVHRDIKPSNLFLVGADPSRVKVLDFGIARVRTAGALDATMLPMTRTGVVIGTVGYMSPEQARGASDVDARTDVFALGCVLYECLTGKPAFSGPNAVAVLAKVLIEEAPRPRAVRREVPHDLDALVTRMLSKAAAERPRDGTSVGRALATLSSSGGRRTPSGSSGVADREQRLVTVVLVRGCPARTAQTALGDVEVVEVADGALVLALRGVDPVAQAATTALALRGAAPGASISIATGRVETTHDGLLGPIIDRAATMLSGEAETVLDELTISLLSGRFELDGPEGQRLVGVAHRAREPRTLLGKPTPCVGREKELALLEATFREAADESVARTLLITGLPGAGKSRIAHELVARIEGDAEVLFARADPVASGSTLSLARQLVRQAAGLRESDPAHVQHAALRRRLGTLFADDALDRAAESLGELVGAPAPDPSPATRAAREDARVRAGWLRTAFVEWVGAECDARPLVLVLEDLHWGDRGSVALVEEALAKHASRPLVVLALARPEVNDMFAGAFSKAHVQEVRLGPLTKRACERLVRAVLPDASTSQTEHVVARAEGNAFCLEELIRHVAEGAGDALPETVLALAETRVARLDPERRRVLRAGSVYGDVLWEGAVAAVLGDAREHVAPLLRALADEEVLVEQPSSKLANEREYAFRHGLLRDAVYATFTDADRAEAHAAAAQWITSAGEKDPRVVAAHYERSSEPDRAVPWLVHAAQLAGEGLDFELADALAERALGLGGDAEMRGEASLIQALYATAGADFARALAKAKDAYQLLPAGTPSAYLAAASLLQNGAYVGDFELAPRIVQDVLTNDPLVAGGAYGIAVQIVSDILDNLGERVSADRLLERATRLANEGATPDPTYMGWLGFGRAAAHIRRDDLPGAFASAAGAVRAFESVSSRFGLALCQHGLGVLHLYVGELDTALERLRESRRAFAAHGGAGWFESWCTVCEGWTWHWKGEHARALACAEAVLSTAEHRHARALAAMVHLELGDVDAAEAVVAEALDGIDDFLVTSWVAALVHTADALVHERRGRFAAGLESVSRAERARRGLAPSIVRSYLDLAHVLCLRGLDAREADLALARAQARLVTKQAELAPEHRAGYAERVPPNAALLAMSPISVSVQDQPR